LLKRRVSVKYAHWQDVSRKLKASANDDDFDELISEYVNAQVLYVDDLLKQKYTKEPVFTDADIKIAFAIFDARYYRNKPTIITTEWDLVNQLLPADEGVFSRVYERCKRHMMFIERGPDNNFRLTA
jgi:DNA replication protein DnaC